MQVVLLSTLPVNLKISIYSFGRSGIRERWETFDKDQETDQKPSSIDNFLFETATQINDDQDYWFKLRGNSLNPMVDAATPLLAMSLRIRGLHHYSDVDSLYKLAVEEIKSIDVEMTELGQEHASMLAYRYILCAFIDEAVMSTPWGADSIWGEYSLLTRFHNESWGGEKVFSILSRLGKRTCSISTLIRIYLSVFVFGFKGRYRVIERGREHHERVISNLHQTLAGLDGSVPSVLTSNNERVVATKHTLGKQVPIWSVFFVSFVASSAVYITYSLMLNAKSSSVLERLQQVLNF